VTAQRKRASGAHTVTFSFRLDIRDGTRSHARIDKAPRCSGRNRNCRNGNWPQIWMYFSEIIIEAEPWLTDRERPASA